MSYVAADQRVTASSGSARYGYQSAAATAEVVSCTASRLHTSTAWPARTSRCAQVSPMTPAPTTTTRTTVDPAARPPARARRAPAPALPGG